MFFNDYLQQTTAKPADWSLVNWSNVISNDINVRLDRSFEIWCRCLQPNWTEPISVDRSFQIRCCLWSNCTRPRDGFAKPPSLFKRHTKEQLRKCWYCSIFELIKQYGCAYAVTPPGDYFTAGPALRARYAMVADVGPSSVRCPSRDHI